MAEPTAQAKAPSAVPTSSSWVHRHGAFSLRAPLVMGVLNVTPDSFSDGGLFRDPERAVARAEMLVQEGAGIVDVGGESTRPGARPVAAGEELGRVRPVIRLLKARLAVPLSIDTRHAAVARAALDEGVEVVNDVSGLGDPAMAAVVAKGGAGLVLMHMRGTPATMQRDPRFADVTAEVRDELARSLERADAAGIAPERIVVDPGIGFGKTTAHNVELVARLDELASLGRPLLIGVSRKAFLGEILGGAPPEERAVATAAACVVALLRGARIFRVHDVRIVSEALAVAEAVRTHSTSVH